MFDGPHHVSSASGAYTNPSFSLAHRLMRQCWIVVNALLFAPSPRPFHAWRAFLLRLFGAHLGRQCHVYPGVKIWAPWNLSLGDHVGVGDGANLYTMNTIHIGDFAVISQGAYLCCGTHDYNSPGLPLVTKHIAIGNHAWICAEAFLHPGVAIPEGAVVGARSVVTQSPTVPWAVYAGNPCRQIGLRRRPDEAARKEHGE